MRQLSLSEDQIEAMLRALSNESTVDQDLAARRVLTPPEVQERAKVRVEIKRLLRGLPAKVTPQAKVKRAIDRALDSFDDALVNGLGGASDDAVKAMDSEQVQSKMRQARALLYSAGLQFCSNLGLKFSSDSADKSETNQEDQDETV